MDPMVDFQIHCALYEMNSLGHHGNRLPRYFITIDKEIVFDYPRDIALDKKHTYLWDNDIDKMSDLIEEYIQCPNEKLFDGFFNDKWGMADILLACDRRIGKKRFQNLMQRTKSDKIKRIIEKRMGIDYAEQRENKSKV